MNLRSKITRFSLTAAASVFLLAQGAVAQTGELHILCSNGIKSAVEKLIPEYERTSGRKVDIKFGASANFKRSIQAGDPFDLAIVTPQIVDDLIKEGKIAAGTHTDLASTGVGLAVRAGAPKPNVSTPDGLKQALLKAKSVAYVKEGASTVAIMNALNRLGIVDEVARKTAFPEGATQSMASVASGQNEIAFALVSEIVPVKGVQFAGPLPAEFQTQIVMAAGIATAAKNRDAAMEFVKLLTSGKAAPIIKATGLDPISKKK